MKTLVTGAGGFIGSHLVERLLQQGDEVRALVHYNARNDWGLLEQLDPQLLGGLEVVSGDIRDPFFVDDAVKTCRRVFHLCSLIAIPYSYRAPQSYVETNIGGAVNLFQAALRHGVERVVHTSTSECYGTARRVPIDESHPLQGQSPYSASKIGADMIAESYWRSFGLPVATLRPFNTYGPRQSARAIIPTIITQALSGDVVKLGALTPTRDLTYVGDTVEGFLRIAACDAAVGRVVNIGSGQEISIGALAQRLLAVMGSPAEVVNEQDRLRPQKSEVERLLCDNGTAHALMGWEPRIGLDEGLERTVAWVRAHAGHYKEGLYNL